MKLINAKCPTCGLILEVRWRDGLHYFPAHGSCDVSEPVTFGQIQEAKS